MRTACRVSLVTVLSIASLGPGSNLTSSAETSGATISLEQRDRAVAELVAAATPHFATLKSLDKEQQRAVLALLVSSQVMAGYESARRPKADVLRDWKAAITPVVPSLAGRGFRSPVYMCLDQSIACASAWAGCDKDNDQRCFEADGPCAGEIACVMGYLSGLKKVFPDLLLPRPPTPPIR